MKPHVQLHMGAVRLILQTCRTNSIYLTAGIKRAIFWYRKICRNLRQALTLADRQDLNASILTGSTRIVDHTTFAELVWLRDPFSPNYSRLPSGFQAMSHLLSKDFIAILEDINALQCIRDHPRSTKTDLMLMVNINSQTASIQSRLAGLTVECAILECCRLAAYICSVMLCCTIWCSQVIPVSQLMPSLSAREMRMY